jgi:CBS domain-containing protein
LKVRELASAAAVTVGPGHSLRDAARMMAEHKVGSAVVQDAEELAGILTERDVLHAVAAGVDADADDVAAHMTHEVVTAVPTGTWSRPRRSWPSAASATSSSTRAGSCSAC